MASTSHHAHHHTGPEMAQCIEDCERCYRVCLDSASHHCLTAGGQHLEPNHFRLMLACAEICRTAAYFMIAGVNGHETVCRACADVCEQCADSCAEIGDMNECVDACRRCASSCRSMAGTFDTAGAGASATDVRKLQREADRPPTSL